MGVTAGGGGRAQTVGCADRERLVLVPRRVLVMVCLRGVVTGGGGGDDDGSGVPGTGLRLRLLRLLRRGHHIPGPCTRPCCHAPASALAPAPDDDA